MRAPQNIAPPTPQAPTFELKGSSLTLMVLYLLSTDGEALAEQFRTKFGQTPDLLRHAPLVLDLSGVREADIDFGTLLNTIRNFGFVPAAVRGYSPKQREDAVAAGLGLLPEGRGRADIPVESASPSAAPQPPPEVSAAAAKPAPRAPVKVITQPIRSGQRIVAEGDLIVLSSVSAGSEILAGRNIHVYGALRGRALAGARGDSEARIFCLNFNPELAAIAGEYIVNEELDPGHVGQQVLVSLEEERLKVEPFGVHPPR